MASRLDALYTTAEIARVLDMDPRTLSKRLGDIEPEKKDGRANWYRLSVVIRHLAGLDSVLDVNRETARLKSAQAALAEMQIERLRGESWPVEAVVIAYSAIVRSARSRLMSIPARFATLHPDDSATRQRLEDWIDDALSELGTERLPPDLRDCLGAYSSDMETDEADHAEPVG